MLLKLLVVILSLSYATADLKVVVLGDWGTDSDEQYEVAEQMGIWVEEHGADFIITTGDNFYSNGVDSPDDDRFEVTWRDVYTHRALTDLPWYISVGNHDHDDDGREWYQVYFGTREPRWEFPELTYSFTAKAGESTALFVAIDTQSIRKDINNKEYQLEYLNDVLKSSNAEWKFVFGHHPAFSCGGHSGSGDVRDDALPIMLDNNVDFYVAGHDHNLQHWQATSGLDIDHITSGGGGRKLYEFDQDRYDKETAAGMTLVKFSYVYGFIYLEINENETIATYVDKDGNIVYDMKREK